MRRVELVLSEIWRQRAARDHPAVHAVRMAVPPEVADVVAELCGAGHVDARGHDGAAELVAPSGREGAEVAHVEDLPVHDVALPGEILREAHAAVVVVHSVVPAPRLVDERGHRPEALKGRALLVVEHRRDGARALAEGGLEGAKDVDRLLLLTPEVPIDHLLVATCQLRADLPCVGQHAVEVRELRVEQHDARAHRLVLELAEPVVPLGPHAVAEEQPIEGAEHHGVGVQPDKALELGEPPDLQLPEGELPALEVPALRAGNLDEGDGQNARPQGPECLLHRGAIRE
mmetsp:Transcript_68712/g.192673  ORF Transcript_68712/g.192673 Transcript_68712/m.192673 type:complete len:288 (-) Transcript_68712:951-1814(-)